MKKFKSIASVVISLVIILSASYIYATSSSTSNKANPYEITSYNIEINVTENNVLEITEIIDAYFNEPRHGIVRTIPLKGEVSRNDNKISRFKARVSNISVSENYTKSTSYGANKELNLQIGDAAKTITGKHTYTIKYKYALGDDGVDDYDELYFNLIGTDWDTSIDKVSFKITMPNDFDKSKLGFTHGKYGSVETEGVDYTVDGNVISGTCNTKLKKHEALTVRLELPQGYFNIIDYTLYIDYAIIALFVIFVIVSVVIWFKYGKDRPVVETVEFYPPEGLNSLELAYANKVKATDKDVTSLLIYLANKGYLRIEEINKKFYKSFKFIKLKDYDGDNEYEKMFLKGLFQKGDEVTQADLTDRFYLTKDKILEKINNSKNKENIIDKKSMRGKVAIIAMIILTVIMILSVFIMRSEEEVTALFVVPLVFVSLILIRISLNCFSQMTLSSIYSGIVMLVVTVSVMIAPISVVITAGLDLKSHDWMTLGIGGISLIILIFFAYIATARTEYGTRILGKIRGFKRFLKTARKEELERLVMENPTYFYDILPYTYILGVSNKWIKKFESINIVSPDWYTSQSSFSVYRFGDSMRRTYRSANTAMASRPSSSSGGGYHGGSSGGHTGGGHSGGGSGGGGGHSW